MTDLQDDKRLSRPELITTLVHYYRAEAQRSLAWRERLDRTTNWAVGATAAFLGFGYSHPEFPHSFFLFGIALIYTLLLVEARRYRFYDAYEYRVRLLHQNFIYHAVAHGTLSEDPGLEGGGIYWRAELASDLRYPQYKMSLTYALGRRIGANYIYLFTLLIVGWLMKIKLHPQVVSSWDAFLQQAAIGVISGWFTLAFMVLFFAHLLVLFFRGIQERGGRDVMRAFREPEQR
ncbi:MAG TPA: DUF2270 domain-containing protein [Geopsychrobacteraceae bacterium]|jgi:uncharacterized membrane protein